MRTPSQRSLTVVLAVAALAALSACGSGQPVEGLVGAASGCTGCHGGLANNTGAPPFDAHGLSSSAAVGAHTAHVDAGVRCDSCHVVPTQVAFPKHQDGVADVTFGAAAQDPVLAATPAYDRTSHTCSNVYCHEPSTAPGGSLPAPSWDAPAGTISGCGACHAANPHGGTVTVSQCTLCHSTSVDAGGNVLPAPGGKHANRVVDFAAHDASWAVTSSNGVTPHGLAALYLDRATYPTGLEGCKTCHGANLATGIVTGVSSCDSCHAGGSAWRTNCTFCHGDAARAPAGAQLGDAAPPRDLRGNTASAKVGAHLVHLNGGATFTTPNTAAVSNGVACGDCHGRTTPTDLVHVVGTTVVTLLEPNSPSTVTGTYDRTAGTCAAAYCHGGFRNGKQATVSWTQTSLTGCDACHQPQAWYSVGAAATMTAGHARHNQGCAPCHSSSTTRMDCRQCHPLYNRPTSGVPAGVVNRTLHVNGTVDVDNTTLQLNWNPVTRTCATPQCHTQVGEHANLLGNGGAGTKSW